VFSFESGNIQLKTRRRPFSFRDSVYPLDMHKKGMFENIVGHRNPVEQLKSDIGAGSSPACFSPRRSLFRKLTTPRDRAGPHLFGRAGVDMRLRSCASTASPPPIDPSPRHSSVHGGDHRDRGDPQTASKSFAQYLFSARYASSPGFRSVLWEGQEAKLKKPSPPSMRSRRTSNIWLLDGNCRGVRP
jgi:hypothetical protein